MKFLELLADWLHPASPVATEEMRAVERAVELADPLLRTAGGYQRHLAEPAARALNHCAALVAALPGPVDIRVPAFAADPLVHALFASAEDIGTTMGRSREVRDFLVTESGDADGVFYSLLGVRRHEKKTMGVSLWGEVLRSDIPQTLLYFSDHTLFGTASRLEETRRQLQAAAFDSIVQGFVEASAGESLLLAEQKISALAEWLAGAEKHLRLEPVSVSVDPAGVKARLDAPGVPQLRLMEMSGRDRLRWCVMLGRFSRSEAREAVARQEAIHRQLLI